MQNMSFIKSGILNLAFYFILSLIYYPSVCYGQSSIRLHSHNDYNQTYPLQTALLNKCRSIEVDVIWDNNRLVVTHDDENLDQKPTFESLYLEPLSQLEKSKLEDLWLLIDIKVHSEETLDAIHAALNKYPNLFKTNDINNATGTIKAILSGDIPRDKILRNSSFKYFFIDGRMSDLPHEYDPYKVPMISANIADFLNGDHNTTLSESSIESISNAINACHRQGKLVRFWNTPDTPEAWGQLIKMGVDVIGVDHPSLFLRYIE